MTIRLATSARNAEVAAVAGLLDAGAGAGTIQIRSGTQPASPNDAAAGTLLATFTLADPAYGAPATGTAALAGTPRATTGVAAGTATWFRALDSTGAAVFDGSVSATGGGGDLQMNTTTVSVGVDLSLTALPITAPA